MKRKLLPLLLMVLFAIPFLSFKNLAHKTKTIACSNSVTVYAQGLTINHVTITVNGIDYVDQIANITSGQNQVFSNSAFSQGSTITVGVNIYGEGAAPRMGGLEIQDPFMCQPYSPGVTHGSITGVKPCATMIVIATHANGCP